MILKKEKKLNLHLNASSRYNYTNPEDHRHESHRNKYTRTRTTTPLLQASSLINNCALSYPSDEFNGVSTSGFREGSKTKGWSRFLLFPWNREDDDTVFQSKGKMLYSLPIWSPWFPLIFYETPLIQTTSGMTAWAVRTQMFAAPKLSNKQCLSVLTFAKILTCISWKQNGWWRRPLTLWQH